MDAGLGMGQGVVLVLPLIWGERAFAAASEVVEKENWVVIWICSTVEMSSLLNLLFYWLRLEFFVASSISIYTDSRASSARSHCRTDSSLP